VEADGAMELLEVLQSDLGRQSKAEVSSPMRILTLLLVVDRES